MYLSIIILPLLSSLVSGFLGRKVGVTGSQIITCGSLIVTSVFLTIAFYEVGICGSPVKIEIINWLDIEILNISWSFYFDQLTVSLGLAVIYCSTLIHIYSVDYLSTDPALCFGITYKWVKLSNSGNTLKLLIPSYSRKAISG
jgi:NADH-ubiquinone oxidoreductase chain 5